MHLLYAITMTYRRCIVQGQVDNAVSVVVCIESQREMLFITGFSFPLVKVTTPCGKPQAC